MVPTGQTPLMLSSSSAVCEPASDRDVIGVQTDAVDSDIGSDFRQPAHRRQ